LRSIAEAGLPGFEATQRSVLLAPRGTPGGIVERLNRDLNAALATDEVKRRLTLEGAEPIPGPPDEYVADVEREQRRWSKLVQTIGIKPE
jgi:tripartite-type tricarboxylate transporter receptor subunit TctC